MNPVHYHVRAEAWLSVRLGNVRDEAWAAVQVAVVHDVRQAVWDRVWFGVATQLYDDLSREAVT